jgi:hypothetical protein
MATTTILDLTDKINQQKGSAVVVIDLGEWISGTIFAQSAGVDFAFSTSNYGGEEEGILNPSPLTASDFVDCRVLNMYTKTQVTSITGSGMLKFDRLGKYLKVTTSDSVTKLIIQLYKII